MSCGDENPPRDEIPAIKDALADFQEAVYDKNPVKLDSLIDDSSPNHDLNGSFILAAVYDGNDSFYSFGQREFFYTEKRAVVKCVLMSSREDSGRPMEITLGKSDNSWRIRNIEFK